jgi:hypothetical protein
MPNHIVAAEDDDTAGLPAIVPAHLLPDLAWLGR